ncbi:MAG: PD40 domain-containing protein [Cytophagaceae bacterium]|nr:PD40 domain-containing protein [Cytophagaceae bacterium]
MSIKYFSFTLFLIGSLLFTNLKAQDVSLLMKNGNKLFEDNFYRKALPFYEQVLVTEPNNTEALFKSGVCYLNRYSKDKALVNIQKSFDQDPKIDKHIHYWLGRAYHLNYQFDKAKEEYNVYKNTLRKSDSRRKEVELYIEQTDFSKKTVTVPSNFLVENLGASVNSSFSEHSPVASSNDSVLYFTTRRLKEGEKEEKDGEPFEDVFVSKRKSDGTWSNPESLNLNTSGHDASIQLYDNDNKLLLYRSTKDGDIFISQKEGDKWGDPKSFSEINSGDFESDAFVSSDGKTVYFATNHYKKFGDMDIYYITKNEDGSWSKHKEMEGDINTEGDEDAPFITPDGKTLYFSSRGHKGMGGFDVFKSKMQADGSWSDPVNLGYPINTPDDDVYFYYAASDDRAYIASYRDGGFGEKDIYCVTPIEHVIVYGKVTEDKTGKVIDGAQISFKSTKKVTNASEDKKAVTAGEYKDIHVLSYNTYKVEISKNGELLSTDSLTIASVSKEGQTINKDFVVPFKGNPADTQVVAVVPPADTTIKTPVVKDPVKVVTTPVAVEKELIVYFASSSAVLDGPSQNEIKTLLSAYKKVKVISVSGHADDKGPDAVNDKIAAARASTVKKYISTKTKVKVSSSSFGEGQPAVPNDSVENRAKNRRVVIKVSGE